MRSGVGRRNYRITANILALSFYLILIRVQQANLHGLHIKGKHLFANPSVLNRDHAESHEQHSATADPKFLFAPSLSRNPWSPVTRSRRPFSEYAYFSANYEIAMRRRSAYSYKANPKSAFFNSSRKQWTVLSFPGLVTDNIIPMDQLDAALEHLNAAKTTQKSITAFFEHIRDRRYFPNDTTTAKLQNDTFLIPGGKYRKRKLPSDEFMRRITWLLPDDGCYYRAEMASIFATDVIHVQPRTIHKLFLFGDALNISTPYDHKGYRLWVYHVVPLMRSYSKGAGEYLVIDPALDQKKPLPVVEWIERQTNGKSLKHADMLRGFLITNRFVYNPRVWNDCTATTGAYDPQRAVLDPYGFFISMGDIDYYLEDEWKRMEDLKLNAKMVLGDHPPWKHAASH